MALWYREVWDDEASYALRVERTLFSQSSEFQRVEVVETPAYGRVLVIDNIFMTSEFDEHFYHEMLVHPAMVTAPAVERVLIVGGGDGGTAREVLRHPSVRTVVMVEIDGVVVEASKTYLPGLGAWDDPRLDLRIGDGVAFVKRADTQPFDVILLDGTDPIGPGKGLFNAEFFRGVKRILRPEGVFAMQSESPIFMRPVFLGVQNDLTEVFGRASPYFGPVPLYCSGDWSWTYASASADPLAIDGDRLAAVESGCKYYNRDIHRAAFALPNYLKRELGRD